MRKQIPALLILGALLATAFSFLPNMALAVGRRANGGSSGGGSADCTANCTFTGTTTEAAVAASGAITSTLAGSSGVGISSSGSVGKIGLGPGNEVLLQDDGSANLTIYNTVLPPADINKDLGSTSKNWRTAYVGSAQIKAQTLPTCGSGTVNQVAIDSTGGTGGKITKPCLCTFDGSTYKWFNLLKGSGTTSGTTTTCPDS